MATAVPDDPTNKEPQDPDQSSDQDQPGNPGDHLVQHLGDAFTAGQIIRALLGGATSGAVRAGIDYLIKKHGG